MDVCLLFGWLNGHLTWTLVVGVVLYLGWIFWHIRRLDRWLVSRRLQPPPDAPGDQPRRDLRHEGRQRGLLLLGVPFCQVDDRVAQRDIHVVTPLVGCTAALT